MAFGLWERRWRLMELLGELAVGLGACWFLFWGVRRIPLPSHLQQQWQAVNVIAYTAARAVRLEALGLAGIEGWAGRQ